MTEEKQIKPAPYSNTDAAEVAAVTILESLLNDKNLKLDIRKRDKIPNIDGYIEIVDDLNCPVGKLEVQIKKLPDNSTKMQCPMSLYAYSEVTGNPIVFLAVDITQKVAYWQHIDSKKLLQPIINMAQDSITIHFTPESVIDGCNVHHVIEWKNIVESNLGRLKELEKYREVFENSNAIVGIAKDEFTNIHYFLDYLNNFLDSQFSIVKELVYPSSWKIGLAYSDYGISSISYTLYSIPINKNDVQIKKMDDKLREKLKNEGVGWRGYLNENPIRTSPRKHAVDLVEEKTIKLLKQRALNLKGSDFLAREFVFAFIDEFREPMGLPKKDQYTIAEIEKGFYHLPIWIIEAINFLVKVKRNNIRSIADVLYRRPYFDPMMLLIQIMDNERKQIEELVQQKIVTNYRIPIIPMGNDKYPFRVFFDLLTFLRESKIDSIQRAYIPKDFSRLKNGAGWVWELYSDDAIDKNLSIFFENLPSAYNKIVTQNFPEIKLPIFGKTNLEVILYKDREKAEKQKEWPIEFFNLVDGNGEDFRLEFRKRDNALEYSDLSFKTMDYEKDIIINEKSYKCIGGSARGLDLIYEDLPMFNYIYSILEKNLAEYFNEVRKRINTNELKE
jgi:hypothetical protein